MTETTSSTTVGTDRHHDAAHGEGDRWTSGRYASYSWTDDAYLHFALHQAKVDGPTTGAQVGFTVNDVDAAHERAVAAAAEVIRPPGPDPGATGRYRGSRREFRHLSEPPAGSGNCSAAVEVLQEVQEVVGVLFLLH